MSTLKSIFMSATILSLAIFSSASDVVQASCVPNFLSSTLQQSYNPSLY